MNFFTICVTILLLFFFPAILLFLILFSTVTIREGLLNPVTNESAELSHMSPPSSSSFAKKPFFEGFRRYYYCSGFLICRKPSDLFILSHITSPESCYTLSSKVDEIGKAGIAGKADPCHHASSSPNRKRESQDEH